MKKSFPSVAEVQRGDDAVQLPPVGGFLKLGSVTVFAKTRSRGS